MNHTTGKETRMPLLKLWEMLAPAALLTLGACSGAPQMPEQYPPADAALGLPELHMPGNTQHWTRWQCDGGIILETRHADSSARQLRIKYQGSEATLERQPGRNPLIYENALLSFFTDGQAAVIGAPASDRIVLGGCHLP